MSPTHEDVAEQLTSLQSLADMERPDIPRPVFHCRRCARTVTCSPAQALDYLRGGWPVCCHAIMTIGPHAPPPKAIGAGE